MSGRVLAAVVMAGAGGWGAFLWVAAASGWSATGIGAGLIAGAVATLALLVCLGALFNLADR